MPGGLPRGFERIRQARTVHGRYSAEMIALRREMARWARLARAYAQGTPSYWLPRN
ncbi:MAG: hypothetical protein JO212_04035 [Acetobacteraceae bacterium]|nr:hypothetical protein [Acetobacteraceae bacterium]